MKKASARNPPRIASKKAVPIKLVTMLAEAEGEKCINLERYKTRLLAFARYARFSNTSTAIEKKFSIMLSICICIR